MGICGSKAQSINPFSGQSSFNPIGGDVAEGIWIAARDKALEMAPGPLQCLLSPFDPDTKFSLMKTFGGCFLSGDAKEAFDAAPDGPPAKKDE
mmetsp:Transcript_19525/g.52615  ORF Transcript_19525/g.52615 Transcript_19525/m.52615 type:complete len:93 (+) Transcript_19525:32-310(+)|eukprot:CAMPEP_0185156484 /NCGR_PEP_ID=MMETSP1139-20130426/1150_1 /TAXON_ID=298111 /ORGANISM="Pavlova sp., Strain CCMP459" /LENGTH=92 /DNA_ID=CAMNT_0027721483 /DNA_START=37 /DNA_END=315 /DNA_ORIENTATION=-